MATESDSNDGGRTRNPQISLPVVATAEPITIFHYEVMSVNDSQVATLTTQLLYVSFCLVVVAAMNFVWDLGRSNTTTSGAVSNLLVALALPACGIKGVREKNPTCIFYFNICSNLCAFITILSIISVIAALVSASEDDNHLWYAGQIVLHALFLSIYCRGANLSEKLRKQPYFTSDRTNPSRPYNVHQNTAEVNIQPVAHAEFVNGSFSSAAAADAHSGSYGGSSSQPLVVAGTERDRQTPMVAVHDSNSVYVNRNPHSSVPVVTTAEPITIFHYEVMSVGDPQVAKMTNQLLHVSCCLVFVAVLNFIWDLGRSSLSTSGAVWNLTTALALPACGYVGVRDNNLKCIQYFCCCNYMCAFCTFISLTSVIVLLAGSTEEDNQTWYAVQLVLLTFFFMVYCRGGQLSEKLRKEPYFTSDRTNPRRIHQLHQNTTEVNVQPVAQAVFVDGNSAASPPSRSNGHMPGNASVSEPTLVSATVVSTPGQVHPPSPTYKGSDSNGETEMVMATAVAVPVRQGN